LDGFAGEFFQRSDMMRLCFPEKFGVLSVFVEPFAVIECDNFVCFAVDNQLGYVPDFPDIPFRNIILIERGGVSLHAVSNEVCRHEVHCKILRGA
jgi:hypothetical protein